MSEALMDNSVIDPEEMRDAAKRFLADQVDIRAAYAEPPRDEANALFGAMAELGWTLLTVPADLEGLGQSFSALAPIYEEMGRVISPVALFPSMASLELLTSENVRGKARELAKRVAVGDAQVAVALVRAGSLTVAERTLTGSLQSVLADSRTSHLLVLIDNGSPSAWLIDLTSAGVTMQQAEMWDRSRRVVDIVLDGASAAEVLEGGVLEAIGRVRAHIDLAIAWDSIGGAKRSLNDTVAYMLTRQQFGRQIGSFQALKHRAADHKVAIEIAAALVRHATESFAAGDARADILAGQARLIANDAYHAMAEDSIQLHGGIGFTWEHDCHVFLKRALLNDMLFDTPDQRRDRLAPSVIEHAMTDRI